jgi:hypothetical protein
MQPSNLTYANANAVIYANASKIGTTSSNLNFNGTNLGIGTTTIYGTNSNLSVQASATAGQTGVVLSDGTTATLGLALATPSANSTPYIYSNVGLALGTNGGERVRIDTSGNVGIGNTATPNSTVCNGFWFWNILAL